MAQEGRSILAMIFRNFIKSFRIRQYRGNFVGKDYIGNKYFEIPADPQGGKRTPSRWFEPAEHDNFEQEMPAEWEAWLRARRKVPPTEEEIAKNYAIIQMKKQNALKLQENSKGKGDDSKLPKQEKGMESFPTYDEGYEMMPGKKMIDKKDKT